MANISTYLEKKLLDHSTGTAEWTMPATVYAALYIAAPTKAGGGTQVSASDYVRIPVTFTSADDGSTTNANTVRFPAAGTTASSWGTAVALGLFDAFSSGNLLWFGNLSANVVLNSGGFYSLAPGQLTITLS